MTSPKLRSICQDACAEYGDPPCYEVHEDLRAVGKQLNAWSPCAECLAAAGIETPEPLDPNAVVRRLL